jgi:hypothetical protein
MSATVVETASAPGPAVELTELPHHLSRPTSHKSDAITAHSPGQVLGDTSENNNSNANPDEEQPSPGTRLDGGTLLKVLSAGFSFFVAGVNDGSIGALLPYVLREYDVSTAVVTAV